MNKREDREARRSSRRDELLRMAVTDLCAVVAWGYFHVLNRVVVVRPYRGPSGPNLMFLANHQSPLDSFLIALEAFFPRLLFSSRLHPWNAAAAEYWFASRWRRWLSSNLRCLPVRTGNDAAMLRAFCRRLPTGITIFFPEGRRSPTGALLPGRPGAGFVAQRSRACIVPVAIDGLLEAMPYERPVPHFGKRIKIAFGDPIEYEDLCSPGATREVSQAIVDRGMAEIQRLHCQLRTMA